MKIISLKIIILLTLSGIFNLSNAQTTPNNSKYILGFIPSKASNIYGLAIGPIGSESLCNVEYTRKSHGLNIQLPGQGVFLVFFGFSDKIIQSTDDSIQKIKTIHNGLLISILGTTADIINGVNISSFMSAGKKMNGFSFNIFWNAYYKINGICVGIVNTSFRLNGLQIGLLNKSTKVNGLQIGLLNKNEKRILPFINW
ncbi:MAG: hypothetical protein HPY79_07440 [Bacteroidales bacterium]|nr:hypothetical protein [Bacteroidales bacterium]